MLSTPKSLLLAAAAAGALIAPASASANTELAPSLQEPTQVAAYDGTVMWSVRDDATGKFKLVQSVDGGAASDVAVPERSGAFDIDLGTNRSGSTYAVYTRDGDIYRLNPKTGAETKLSSLSSPTRAERDPSIYRGRIAFVREENGKDYVRIGDTTSGSHGTKSLVSARDIFDVELGLKQIAYREYDRTRGFGSTEIHVRNVTTGHDQDVYRATSGGASMASASRPSFLDDQSGFVWTRTNNGSGTGNRVIKYTLRTGKLSYAAGSSRYATSAWAGSKLGLAVSTALSPGDDDGCFDNNTPYCSVQLTGSMSFDASRG